MRIYTIVEWDMQQADIYLHGSYKSLYAAQVAIEEVLKEVCDEYDINLSTTYHELCPHHMYFHIDGISNTRIEESTLTT